MHVLLWLNTMAALEMFFIERIFAFLMTILEEDGNIKCNQISLSLRTP